MLYTQYTICTQHLSLRIHNTLTFIFWILLFLYRKITKVFLPSVGVVKTWNRGKISLGKHVLMNFPIQSIIWNLLMHRQYQFNMTPFSDKCLDVFN